MEKKKLCIVVAVYNRPDELQELLESLVHQTEKAFGVVVIEDGSQKNSDRVCQNYVESLDLLYYRQENTGPALARNTGVELIATNYDYILFVDSDCTLPPQYIQICYQWLASCPNVQLWGGPDAWDDNFSLIQKAISYAMTSPYSTGGIRGGSEKTDKFYPRTFNMGVLLAAFRAVNGFRDLRYGEDLDLSMRLLEAGYTSQLLPQLFVYHKRRTSWRSFFWQVFHSGSARIMLVRSHPKTLKLVHALPSLGVLLFLCLLCIPLSRWQYVVLGMGSLLYVLVLFSDAYKRFHSSVLALKSVFACAIMLLGYGLGFFAACLGIVRHKKKN